MDALSTALAELRLESSLYCRIEAAGPWGVRYDPMPMTGFHVVLRGRAVLDHDGTATPLSVGDCVVVPHGAGHVVRAVATPAGSRHVRGMPQLMASRPPADDRGVLRLGAPAAPTTTYLCGVFRFALHADNPLLAALPPLLLARGDEGLLGWIESELAPAAREAGEGRAGADLVLSRLSDVLLVRVLRAHLSALPVAEASWLSALRDGAIAKAMAAIHREPERPWTVEALGAVAGMSRSRFSARFTELVGRPPLTYLTDWRMWRARALLREGRLPLAEVARALGYQSEAAFSVAFARTVGMPPGRYRRAA